jgi:hypothetical protein
MPKHSHPQHTVARRTALKIMASGAGAGVKL